MTDSAVETFGMDVVRPLCSSALIGVTHCTDISRSLGNTQAVAPVTRIGHVTKLSHMFFVYILISAVTLTAVTQITAGIIRCPYIYSFRYRMANPANNIVHVSVMDPPSLTNIVRELFVCMTDLTALRMGLINMTGIAVSVSNINRVLHYRIDRVVTDRAVIIVRILEVIRVTGSTVCVR